MDEDNYKVLSPGDALYERYLRDFWNYFLSTSPNPIRETQSQPGPVFHLRANKSTDGLPMTRVGSNGVIIRKTQKVFIPVMIAVADSQNSNAPTIQDRRRIVRIESDQSESPEKMIATIDGKPIIGSRNLADFYVETEEDFPLNVPQGNPYSDPAMSDLNEVYSYPGTFDAIANGYAVIIYDMKPRKNPYRLIIKAEGRDDYRAEAYYDIFVQGSTQEETFIFAPEKTFTDILEARSIKLSKTDIDAWNKCIKASNSARG